MNVISVIAWLLLAMLPVNVFFMWQATRLNRAVHPRSPLLRSLWWVAFSIFLMNTWFAIVAYRYLANIQPVMPFGGFGLGVVILFILSVPGVVWFQMQRFVNQNHREHDERP